MDVEDAMLALNAITKSERFEKHFDHDTDNYSYHVWSDTQKLEHDLTLITDECYRAAKLVGKRQTK